MEVTQWDQTGLALEDPDSRLPLDSREGGCLGERMGCSDDLDPILKSRMGSEGNQIIVNACKGKNLICVSFDFSLFMIQFNSSQRRRTKSLCLVHCSLDKARPSQSS